MNLDDTLYYKLQEENELTQEEIETLEAREIEERDLFDEL
jgi:hypothetical protein